MRLSEIISVLPRGSGYVEAGGPSADPLVSGVAYDSRTVVPGDLFVCIEGLKQDGHVFAKDAVAGGAVAVVAREGRPLGEGGRGLGVPVIRVRDTREALALVSSAFFGHPSKKMRVIGVTGTNGKTTTTYLTRAVLSAAGRTVGLIGTVENVVGTRTLPVVRTTPEAPDLQRLFSDMVDCGSSHVVMEASSHALDLKRVAGTEFDIGVFTNLTQDHLDYHRTMESYFQAKAKLFAGLGRTYHGSPKPGRKAAVVNVDDPVGERLVRLTDVPVVTYGMSETAAVRATDVSIGLTGTSYRAITPAGEVRLALKLLGRFNVYNSLAAMSVGLVEDVPLDVIAGALESSRGVPGRFELVDEGQDFAVVVDYAHTPDGLKNVLESAREVSEGRVIVVFGCGGDRDRLKRPIMGDIAARLADFVIITSDNPRSEDPEAIVREIERGVVGVPGATYAVCVDRREAIQRAVTEAGRGDVVVIAGKGHETYQIFKDRTVQFDDREVARDSLRSLLK